ncbi:hypothetical protein ACT3CD_16840 [Geofilum sp. OHC36d9]|uniref:hypothetical protein n=1 Tax=Geofilum sp. OHC36d9 TaxID=3458413 RepID=UPI0040336C5A
MNEIYGPAVVNWNVSIDKAIEVLNINEADFIVESTALLSKYTSDMNRVIRIYKRDRVTDDNTLYLFFMTLSNLGSSRKGFMPLAGNYGFIFNFEAQDLELLAHELAHGAFNLRHTFSDKSVYYFPVNQTANLMDYAGGVELWKYQWDLIHDPESILFAWGQDESEGAAFGQPDTKFLCINDEKALAELSEFQTLYLPDGKKADLNGKYVASGFYLSDDITESAQGAIYSLRINGYDNVQIFNQDYETAGFGYKITDETAVRSISADVLKAADDAIAYKVFINKKNDNTGQILVKKDDELVKTIDFTGDCKCTYPPRADEIYFKTNSISKAYIDYYQERSLKIDQAIYQDEELVSQLVQEVNDQQINGFSEDVFGKVFTDKLKTYEKINNRKFYVVLFQTNILCLHQSSWNRLADEVFLRANLPEDAILITLPYVQCSGIGGDLGEYYFMPGLSHGSNIKIDFSGLKKDYKNTQRTASFIADNSYSPTWTFVKDVFKNTVKQYVRHYFYINARGEILGRSETEALYSGFPGTVDFRLVVDGRIEKYFDLLEKTEATMERQLLAGASEHVIAAHNKARQDAEHDFNNFFTDNPSPEDFIVDHGMNEFIGTTDENNCVQFTQWYRDRIYAVDKKQTSPSGDCFYAGRNEVDYKEKLASIDALGLIFAPFNFDWVADGIGLVYSGFHFDFTNSSIYGTGMVIPLVSTGAIKSSSKALIRGLRSGESRITREGSEYVIKWVRNDFGDIDKLLRRLDSPDLVDAFKKYFNSFTEATKKTFLEKPELVGSWKLLDEVGVEGLAGKIDNIEIVDDFVRKYPDKIDDLKKTLSEAFDADGILKSIRRFDEIPTINSTDDLIEVLENVTDVNTVAQLEQKGVKSFFRGTTRSKVDGSLFPGNPNTQLGGISTSTDPVRGTIFAIESATANPNFKGVLQMGLPTDLGDIKLIAPNGRANIELEAIMNVSADNFSSLAKVEIPIEEARRLVKEIFDIDLQSSISRQLSDDLLNSLPVSDLNKSLEFYQKAIQFSTK